MGRLQKKTFDVPGGETSGFKKKKKVRIHGSVQRFSTFFQDIHSQGEVISCLERALVKEAEQQDHARTIKEECQKAILRVAELSSDDFHLDRHLYFSCRDDRERFCPNVRAPPPPPHARLDSRPHSRSARLNACSCLQVQAGEGKVYKCLFNHKFEEAMAEKVTGSDLTGRKKKKTKKQIKIGALLFFIAYANILD